MRRNLKVVPVVDAQGNKLYELDRTTAAEHIKQGLALSVKGKAIRMKSARLSPSALGVVDAEALAGIRPMSARQSERLVGHFEQANRA